MGSIIHHSDNQTFDTLVDCDHLQVATCDWLLWKCMQASRREPCWLSEVLLKKNYFVQNHHITI